MAMATSSTTTAPFQFGRVVSATFGALRQNLATYLILALVFSALPSIAVDLLFAKIPAPANPWSAFQLNNIKTGLENVFSYPLIAAVILGVSAYARGETLTLEEAWTRGLRAWWSLFALDFVKNLRVGIGLVLLIVPGMIWAAMWAVALPIKMLENRPLGACLTRSEVLTKGRRWPIVGLIAVFLVGTILTGLVLGLVAGILIGVLKATGLPFTGVIELIASAAITMVIDLVGAAGIACLYFELKTTREGLEPTAVAAVFS